jgi:electron transfer flavoprotein alpha subunit
VNESNPILVVAEVEDGSIAPVTFEILKAGTDLARQGGASLCACVLGHNVAEIAAMASSYADRVYVIDHPLLALYQSDTFASALETLCRALDPCTVLMGHTGDNLELAPRVAYRMGRDLVTDCTGVERDRETGSLLCSKPIYGGNAVAVLQVCAKPQVATIRPKSVAPMEKRSGKGEIVNFQCDFAPSPALTESLKTVPGERVSLDEADAIVSGGRGFKTAEDIEELGRLIGALERYFVNVELGASRPVIDAGLLPHSRQVGQTGEKVSPQVYVAVAISGASQHMAGILGSKKIVAINKDPEAPIFGCADYGVVGRYEEIIPALVKTLEEVRCGSLYLSSA